MGVAAESVEPSVVTEEAPRTRPVLKLRTPGAAVAAERTEAASGEEVPVGRDEGPTAPTASDEVASGERTFSRPVADVSDEPEHEGVAIARRSKEAEDPVSPPPAPQDVGPEEGVATSFATALVVPAEDRDDGADRRSAPSGTEDPARSMSYHEALGHIERTSARRGHVDIDDRITEYVRTGRRDALDRPTKRTLRRELMSEVGGVVDERLAEARRVVEGGITSRDVSVQVAIDAVEARRPKDLARLKDLSKGPAAKGAGEVDVVAAAASRSSSSPGL